MTRVVPPTVADTLEPVLGRVFGDDLAVELRFWDGSAFGRPEVGTVRFNRSEAVRRMVWSPDELGLARAFVVGDIDVDGNMIDVLRAVQIGADGDTRALLRVAPELVRAATSIGGLGTPPPRPPEEVVPHGIRHSRRRDRTAVSHHYDVGNDFYELVLGPSMTDSCARFTTSDTTREEAQSAKHESICRKLGLDRPQSDGAGRRRLLDVGCGWGSMAIHAASQHDVDVVGVTVSNEQATAARRRVADAALADRIEIRVEDYREVDDGPYDAISSIGMAEHVGHRRMVGYFERLFDLLSPGGRLLNHAIASVGGSRLGRRSFVNRYVFPDGELLDIADTVRSMERAGFEVRDVENLREHYEQTLRCWVGNLGRQWDAAVDLVGEARSRVWLMYMSGSVNGFQDAGLQIYQTLGVRRHVGGASDMPRTRAGW
ncbi:MAG TPA: class I SAM-dependent methyltransferase [Ilumatobacteraceae bacterium]|nr:class I SAM-dependent methyltransferase [Ilumatobacteraceae bacterium]